MQRQKSNWTLSTDQTRINEINNPLRGKGALQCRSKANKTRYIYSQNRYTTFRACRNAT